MTEPAGSAHEAAFVPSPAIKGGAQARGSVAWLRERIPALRGNGLLADTLTLTMGTAVPQAIVVMTTPALTRPYRPEDFGGIEEGGGRAWRCSLCRKIRTIIRKAGPVFVSGVKCTLGSAALAEAS